MQNDHTPLWMVECRVKPDIAPVFMDVFSDWSLGTSWEADESLTRPKNLDQTEVRIQALFACPAAEVQQLEQEIGNRLLLAATLAGIECPVPRFQAVPPKNWLLESYQQFPPIHVGRYYVHGSHIKRPPQKPGLIPIQVDAATAFGSGKHATTQGCLQLLDQLANSHIFSAPLDLGCGSGILALAMAATWGNPVVATDIDPEAMRVTQENAQLNGLETLIAAYTSDGLKDLPEEQSGPFDLIVANILVGPLCQLAPYIANALTPQGYVVLSGILVSQIPQIAQAYRVVGLHVQYEAIIQEWAALVLTRLGEDE